MNKNLSRRIISVIMTLILVICLMTSAFADYENTYKNTGKQAADLIGVGFTQIGYTDVKTGVKYSTGEDQEISKYGTEYSNWVGDSSFKYGSWCAMFITWCAHYAGISTSILPMFASCGYGVSNAKNAGVWKSASSYTPKAGDIVFYDWDGNAWADHVGIVLYTENGYLYSLEGNTVANRLDGGTDTENVDTSERVMVRARSLSDSYIYGYACPNYKAGTSSDVVLNGYVDLESSQKTNCTKAINDGAISAMSSHTFGPYYGITRAQFIHMLYTAFKPTKISLGIPFTDVSVNSTYYSEIMTFKNLGIISGTTFNPNTYILVSDAKTILSKACSKFGVSVPNVTIKGNEEGLYVQRYEAANIYCALCDPSSTTTDTTTDTTTGTSYVEPFTDVSTAKWYAEAVKYVYDNNIMDGTSDTTFGPNLKFTRAMVAQVIYAMEGKPTDLGDVRFDDVPQEKWYFAAISWAGSKGIVSGYGNDKFGPNDNVTRQQMIAILYKYAEYIGADTSGRAEITTYSDYSKISAYAQESISWAVAEGIITGRTDGSIDPNGTATRAEVAQMLKNFNQNIAGKK